MLATSANLPLYTLGGQMMAMHAFAIAPPSGMSEGVIGNAIQASEHLDAGFLYDRREDSVEFVKGTLADKGRLTREVEFPRVMRNIFSPRLNDVSETQDILRLSKAMSEKLVGKDLVIDLVSMTAAGLLTHGAATTFLSNMMHVTTTEIFLLEQYTRVYQKGMMGLLVLSLSPLVLFFVFKASGLHPLYALLSLVPLVAPAGIFIVRFNVKRQAAGLYQRYHREYFEKRPKSSLREHSLYALHDESDRDLLQEKYFKRLDWLKELKGHMKEQQGLFPRPREIAVPMAEMDVIP